MKPLVLSLLIVASSAAAETRTIGQAVVYGEDDRVPVEEHPSDFMRAVASRSVVAIVDESLIGRFDTADSLREREGLCPNERFGNLPSVSRCTGVLIADDLVMTAGHCMENAGACRSRAVVFGWLTSDGRASEPDASAVYRCAEVIAADTRGYANLDLDYSVIRLDRPVEQDLEPVELRVEPVVPGEPVILISHPSGIPMTIDSGGSVVDAREGERDYFVVDTDSFEGSSGGPILDSSGRLLGILVRGEEDYVDSGDCRTVNVLTAGSEEVTRAEWALRAFCAERLTHALCATRDACGVVCASDCVDSCVGSSPPGEWSCVDEVYGAGDGCDCGCGTPDPDCDTPYESAFGCGVGAWCSDTGECVEAGPFLPPVEWVCNPAQFYDSECDCDCGLVDPACSTIECEPPRKPRGRCATGSASGGAWGALCLVMLARRRDS